MFIFKTVMNCSAFKLQCVCFHYMEFKLLNFITLMHDLS